jgi:heptosyltransferase-2
VGRARIAAPAGGFRDIAVLRLSSLGDIVLTLPVVHALRAAYPDAKLHYWVKEEFADLVRFDPAIDHVRELEKDASRVEDLVSMGAELESCDLIVDLHGSARTRLLTWRQRAPVLRAASQRLLRERWVRARWTRPRPADHATARYAAALSAIPLAVTGEPRLSAGSAAEAWAEQYLAEWGAGPAPVALCPGARHATKRWPEDRWCALDEALARAGERRLVFTTAAERRSLPALAARIDADPGARWCVEPLPRMAALLSRVAAAVTHDSGLMHLAAARGARVVALFGSTSPALGFGPSGTGHVVLCRNEPCQPCTLHGRESCPKGHFRCMMGIEVGQVLGALASVRPVRLSAAEPVA